MLYPDFRRPSGTRSFVYVYPALKCRAIFMGPTGTSKGDQGGEISAIFVYNSCRGPDSEAMESRPMGRQTQLHVLPKDLNELLVAMHEKDPLEVAIKSGNTATPEPLAFIPENITGQTLVLWSERFAPNLQRNYIANAQPPYYCVEEQTESVFELSLSALTTWEGRPALTQGRIYAVFEDKQAEFEKCYERIVRYIRRHWRKNPAAWMGGYVGPAASDWFERGGLLLPNYIPPVRSDWIQRLGEQHITDS